VLYLSAPASTPEIFAHACLSALALPSRGQPVTCWTKWPLRKNKNVGVRQFLICTKLAVCDKYEHCDIDYHAGAFLDPLDLKVGEPYGATSAVVISPAKRAKHQCLVKFVPAAL
jgi:hypothetical protein